MANSRFTGDFDEAIITRPEHQVDPAEIEKADDQDTQAETS